MVGHLTMLEETRFGKNHRPQVPNIRDFAREVLDPLWEEVTRPLANSWLLTAYYLISFCLRAVTVDF